MPDAGNWEVTYHYPAKENRCNSFNFNLDFLYSADSGFYEAAI